VPDGFTEYDGGDVQDFGDGNVDPAVCRFPALGGAEAITGGVGPAKLSAKMANTISKSNQLYRTYSPT
jgi:hypothetical protein